MECLRFCLLHEFGRKGADSTVQEYLIKEQVGKFLHFSLSILSFSHLFSLHIMTKVKGKPSSMVSRSLNCYVSCHSCVLSSYLSLESKTNKAAQHSFDPF